MVMHTQETCTTTVFMPFRHTELLRRIRGEFREMPGLRLSLEQAMRLWSLDRATCVDVLRAAAVSQVSRHRHQRQVSIGPRRVLSGGAAPKGGTSCVGYTSV